MAYRLPRRYMRSEPQAPLWGQAADRSNAAARNPRGLDALMLGDTDPRNSFFYGPPDAESQFGYRSDLQDIPRSDELDDFVDMPDGAAPPPWDATDEPDAFSPLEMIQPDSMYDAESQEQDDADLNAWLGGTQAPDLAPNAPVAMEATADEDLDLDRFLAARDASVLEPAPEPNPEVQKLRRLGDELADNSKAGDDGLSAAQNQGASAYNSSRWARVFAGALDPQGVATRENQARQAAQQPVENWQIGQRERTAKRAGVEAQRNAQSQEAANLRKLQQQMEIEQGRAGRADRALDLRENQLDPNSDWNRQRAGESQAQWQQRLRASEDMRQEGVRHDAPFKGKNAALSSGSPAAMRAAGINAPTAPGAFRVENDADAQAEALILKLETDGIPIDSRWSAVINQVRNPQLSTTERRDLVGTINKSIDQDVERNEGAARQFGEALNRSNVTPIRNQVEVIKNMIGDAEDIPGVGADNTIANIGGVVGERFIGPRARQIRSAVKKLGDMRLRDATGAAAPVSEQEEFRSIAQAGTWDTDEDFRNGLAALESFLDRYEGTMEQTFGPNAADLYRSRGQRRRPAAQPRRGGTPTNINQIDPSDISYE